MNTRHSRYAFLFLALGWLLGACSAQPIPPAIDNQASPQATTLARAAAPRIVTFSVSPNPVERGEDLSVTWQVDGASQATLWPLIYDPKTGRWHRQPDPLSSGSNVGEYRLAVPRDARERLRFELEAKNAAGDSVTLTSDEILLACHPLFFKAPSPSWCPNAPEITSAAVQAFEGGYMIRRADTGQVYVLRKATSDLPADWFAFYPTEGPESRDMPAGEFTSGEHFQRAWANLPEYWHSLGTAIAPEQMYTLTMQLSLSLGAAVSQNDDLYLTWPTGEIAHLRVYLSAPNHASGPAWSFLGSDQAPQVDVDQIAPTASDLIADPAMLTLPAGASGRVMVRMNNCDQKLAAFETSTPPAGLQIELLRTATPCEAVMLLHPEVTLAPGEYSIRIARQSSAGQTATSEISLRVIACREMQGGEFTQDIQSNLIPLIPAGKPAIEHGLLVPLQFCGDRSLTVDLLAATSEAGAVMTTPPRFYLYRSWVWPAPNTIQANPATPWMLNVAAPRIASNGWQLTANVTAGLHLLVFERDAYGSPTDPNDIPASVTYRITERAP